MFDRCVAVLLAVSAWVSSCLIVDKAHERLWERQQQMVLVAALLGLDPHLCNCRGTHVQQSTSTLRSTS